MKNYVAFENFNLKLINCYAIFIKLEVNNTKPVKLL